MENNTAIEKENMPSQNGGKKWDTTTIVGLIIFLIFMVALLIVPQHVAGIFSAMSKKAFEFGVQNYIMSVIAGSIIVSIMVARLLERGGVTDAMIKLFTPVSKLLKVNPTTLVPGIYNFIGDVNAAGKITAPILQNAGTTKDEKKIAIATMMQMSPAFGAFLIGINLLAAGHVNAFFVIVMVYLVPLFLVPLILRCTIYRKCEYKDVMKEIPSFTPKEKSVVDTIFNGAIEGADTLIRLIMPTCCAVFAIVAVLEYINVWPTIEAGFQWVLALCNIEPTTGITSLLVSGIIGMPPLIEMIQGGAAISPGMVVSSMMFGAACMNFVLPLVQIPILWNKGTDLKFGEAIQATIVGWIVRMAYCAIMGYLIVPIFFH